MGFSWDDVVVPRCHPPLGDILQLEASIEPELPWDDDRYLDRAAGSVRDKYVLSDKLWTYLQNYYEKIRAIGNRSSMGIVTPREVSRTMTARYNKDGSEILVTDVGKPRPRKLTPREAARLMGFPDSYKIVVSDSQAWKQFGNSVVVPVVRDIARVVVSGLTK
jgi:DNA (cytosine-5)-methyltransferase 1